MDQLELKLFIQPVLVVVHTYYIYMYMYKGSTDSDMYI